MASSPKPPRPAVSPLMRQSRKKEVPEEEQEEQPESLQNEALAPEDDFVVLSSKIVDVVIRNRVILGGIVAAILLAAIGLGMYVGHREDVENQVAGDVYKAVRTLGVASGPDAKETTPAEYKAAGTQLLAIADDNEGYKAALLARLYAGSAFLEGNDPVQAVAAFEQARSEAKDPTLRYYALSGLAAAHGSVGNDADAIAAYQAMADELKGVWRGVGLMGVGRSLEGQGQPEKAADAYETLLKSEPYSAFVDDARSRLALLRPNSSALTDTSAGETAASE